MTSPAYMTKITIWRLTWSHALGVRWTAMKVTDLGNAENWKAVYEKDEPNAVYRIAKKAPPLPENATDIALHPAAF